MDKNHKIESSPFYTKSAKTQKMYTVDFTGVLNNLHGELYSKSHLNERCENHLFSIFFSV